MFQIYKLYIDIMVLSKVLTWYWNSRI